MNDPALEHITDANLKIVYKQLPWEPVLALKFGEEFFPNSPFKLAMLQAMRCSIDAIISDIKEHPQHMKDGRYNEEGIPFYQRKIEEIEMLIDVQRSSGQTNEIYLNWKISRTTWKSRENIIADLKKWES